MKEAEDREMTMKNKEIRWQQRLNNYCLAIEQLKKFIDKGELSELEMQGLIQSFEYNYELAWNTVKDFFENQGETNILGSRDAFRLAFKRGIIENGELWMNMIKNRALTTHTYNQEMAEKIGAEIIEKYYPEFSKLRDKFLELKNKENGL